MEINMSLSLLEVRKSMSTEEFQEAWALSNEKVPYFIIKPENGYSEMYEVLVGKPTLEHASFIKGIWGRIQENVLSYYIDYVNSMDINEYLTNNRKVIFTNALKSALDNSSDKIDKVDRAVFAIICSSTNGFRTTFTDNLHSATEELYKIFEYCKYS